MSHILVITFEDENQAPDVLRSLKNLEQQEMFKPRRCSSYREECRGEDSSQKYDRN